MVDEGNKTRKNGKAFKESNHVSVRRKGYTQQEEQNRDKTNSQSWGNQINIVNQEYNNL